MSVQSDWEVDGSLMSEFSTELQLLSRLAMVCSTSSFPLVLVLGLPPLAAVATAALLFSPVLAWVTFSMVASNQEPMLMSLQSTNSFI